jgi:hypothetical protein
MSEASRPGKDEVRSGGIREQERVKKVRNMLLGYYVQMYVPSNKGIAMRM